MHEDRELYRAAAIIIFGWPALHLQVLGVIVLMSLFIFCARVIPHRAYIAISELMDQSDFPCMLFQIKS